MNPISLERPRTAPDTDRLEPSAHAERTEAPRKPYEAPVSPLHRLSPSVTTMIRMDHTHVLAAFHKYHADTSPGRKRAIVETACLALEVHAQLEEEIFYPALREVMPAPDGLADSTPEIRRQPLPHDQDVLAEAVPEHDEMRRLIARLREMSPRDGRYDETFMSLMREVMHHVADEETVLLPQAEHLLVERLHTLGAQMNKRRVQLLAPKTPALALYHTRAMPVATLLAAAAAGGVLAGCWLLARALSRRR